ncbi:MAG: FtsW/RodA/SpoVE family cell cycle protein [Oscillospiraceae bacterium]|nr:FtsW/RodA/SpoVE family cell cycle protein [Oscillospiraceae bacterium]MCR5305565.1 FtsW/RodA/SpoVE family cell cycle protein [Oscillospiraceae bacterium]
MKKSLSHPFLLLLILIAHAAMLLLVVFSFGLTPDAVELASAVLLFDFIGFIFLQFVHREACTVDSVLLLVLGMSTIYQSCFGGLTFAKKHFIFAVAAFVICQFTYLLVRNPYRAEKMKPLWYLMFIGLVGAIFFLTGSRGIWIDLGFITLQPSEFVKPVFVLICASSIRTQLHKHTLLGFHYVPDNLALLACTAVIAGLQWYCRDLGSLPTFVAAAGCGLMLRFRYLREKISLRLVIFLCLCVCGTAAAAWHLAPAYVQERLHSDIWADMSGSGYQQVKALTAIAEGGWFGKGAGSGTLIHVAASRTDIVFSAICEEWGLFTGLMTVILVLFLPASLLAVPPRSYYHSGLAVGVAAVFMVQMTLNVFGSCNLIPFTGVTIPFISQGGSSMLSSGILAGFLKAAQAPVLTGGNTAAETEGGR